MKKNISRPHMESIYARNFSFCNSDKTWRSIYNQKICTLKIAKMKELNFKILHNIVPCGKVLSKWRKDKDKNVKYVEN